MQVDLTALGSFLIGVGGIVAAIVAGMKNRKDSALGATAETRLLLQTTSEQLLATLEQISQAQKELTAKDVYIGILRDHIYQEKPPPPPEPPK